MAAVLGKRKACELEDGSAAAAAPEDAQAVFRRYFESQFRPLEHGAPLAPPRTEAVEEDEEAEQQDIESESDSSVASEWGGVSEDEQDASVAVEVVDYSTNATIPSSIMSKRELKAFMSSRPPPTDSPTIPAASMSARNGAPSSSEAAGEEGEDSAAFLANDLALQRLIAESHLLSQAASTSTTTATATANTLSSSSSAPARSHKLAHTGRTRLAQTALRLQLLGSTASAPQLVRRHTPHAIRRGIDAAARDREAARRQEARENGIVLERATPGKLGSGGSGSDGNMLKSGRGGGRKRERGGGGVTVDRPGVGKMRGAELKISRREVRDIEGGGGGGGRGKKGQRTLGRKKRR